MSTLELTIPIADTSRDVLMALLLDLGAEAFLEEDDRLQAYGPAAQWHPSAEGVVRQWMEEHGIDGPIQSRIIEDENWNARWEETIEPIRIGTFLIRPSWKEALPSHDPRFVLVIDPKMSFGTGHHASTRLLLRLVPELVTEGAAVLDAGTGTGILALAAARCGAAEVMAFDTDAWAVENARENVDRNDESGRITILHGALDVVPMTPFDVVIANINRDVILRDLPGYVERLREGGRIALSGLLLDDRPVIHRTTDELGLVEVTDAIEEGWWAGVWESGKRRI